MIAVEHPILVAIERTVSMSLNLGRTLSTQPAFAAPNGSTTPGYRSSNRTLLAGTLGRGVRLRKLSDE